MTVLFHSSAVEGLTQFNDHTHFAHTIAPSYIVATHKVFSYYANHPEAILKSLKPTLYICESLIDEKAQLFEYPDLFYPDIGAVYLEWRKQFSEKDREEMARHFNSRMDEDKKIAFLKKSMADQGMLGYRYKNIAEGGTAICLLDASHVKVVDSLPISWSDLAQVYLKQPKEDSGLDDQFYKIARDRALSFI